MKAVSRLTGLSADRLRVWESRHGVVRPARTANGRRKYSEQDVSRLRLLAELLKLGHSIGGLCELSSRELMALQAKSGHAASSELEAADISELLSAVGEFRLDALRASLAKAKHLLSPQDFAFRLVPQLMAAVGERVESGSFTIAQEHAVSDLLRHQLRQIYDDLQPLNGRKKFTVVFGAPEGHQHDFGVLLVAIRCRFHGLETHFLGPNLPSAALVNAAKELKARALVLGVSAIPPEELKMEINAYLKEVDKALPRKISVWLGGSGVGAVQRKKLERDVWIFGSIEELEQKLKTGSFGA